MSNFQRPLFQLALFFAVAIGIPHVLLAPFAQSRQPKFDNKPTELLKKTRPEIVLIGNSMLQTRIDSQKFEEAIGRRSLALPMGGSASAKWYLSLKNAVLPSKVSPRSVIIFFRDYELIDPLFRTTGQYRNSLAQMKQGPEPELTAIQRQSREWREVVWDALYDNSWVIRVNRDIRNAFVTTYIRDHFPRESRTHLTWLTKSRFDVEGLRDDMAFEADALGRAPTGDPKVAIERSLLPQMVSLAKSHGIQLVLYRVARRGGILSVTPEFLAALKEFCTQNGVLYLEEEELFGALEPLWYADGDHVRASKRYEYSRLLGRKLKERIP